MSKSFAILLALVIALLPATIFAQSDMPTVFCGSLDEADCDLLLAAAENDEGVTDGAYDVTFDFLMQNVPDLPFEELGLTWLQTGRYTSDPDLREELMAEIDVASAEELQDVDTMMQFVEAFLASSDTEQLITLQLSDALVEAMNAETGFPVPDEINLSFAIIDGVIYIDLEQLSAFIPELGGLGGWFGTELAPFLRMGLEAAAADPDTQGALMAVGMAVASNTGEGKAAMEAAAADQAAMVEEYLSIERLGEDEQLDDEDAAVFLTTFDLAGFAASPEFMDLVKNQMTMMEQMGQDVPSQDELADMEEMMPMMAPMLFEDFNYDIYQLVGLDSELTRGTAVDMEWDMASLMAMAEADGAEVPAVAPYFAVSAAVDSYDQGKVGELTAPAGAMVLPADMLLNMMQ